jgi:exopolysaccharide biosynthesis protein
MKFFSRQACVLLGAAPVIWLAGARDAAPGEKSPSLCKGELKSSSENIADGIDLISESCSSPLYKAFIAKVSLQGASHEIITTPAKLHYSELSVFAQETGSILATNGGFFSPDHGGWFMSFGKETGKFVDDENSSVLAFGKNENGKIRVKIFPPEHVMPKGGGAPAWIVHGLTGMPILVKDGKVNTVYPPDDLVKFKKGEGDATTLNGLWIVNHPRTAVGISKDESWMMLVVVDGRQKEWSRGMRIEQLARFMQEHDAWNAINLDGGCSSAMWVKAKSGIVNSQCIQHGKIRKTAEHIGVVPLKKQGKSAGLSKLLARLLQPSHPSVPVHGLVSRLLSWLKPI